MKKEEALQARRLLEMQTLNLTDQQALEVATFVPRWQTGKLYIVDDRVSVEEDGAIVLYKALQQHVSQETHKPSQDTAALWMRIDVEHAGTAEDPIPYRVNMEVFEGKYYTEEDVLYKCIRNSGIALQSNAYELVGVYFEEVI